MELNKCPNCSGKLVLANNRKRLVCSYCGSEFPLDEATRNEIGNQPVNMDWFIYDWDLKSLQENDSCKTMIQAFIRTLNDYETSSAIESYMREYLMGFDDVSANGIREEKMKDIAGRLTPDLLPGERIVLERTLNPLCMCLSRLSMFLFHQDIRRCALEISMEMTSEAAADLYPTLILKAR